MTQSVTHITTVEIRQLWNDPELNVKWNLHRDVNILAGDNGSGKSTILELIANLSAGNVENASERNVISLAEGVHIVFANNHSEVLWHKIRGSHSYVTNMVKKSKNHTARKLLANINKQLGGQSIVTELLFPENSKVIRNSQTEEITLVHFDVINTFDQPLFPLEVIQQVANQKVRTYLDFRLAQLEKQYLNYQVEIGKQALEMLSSGADINNIIATRQTIDAKKNRFLDMIDELFKSTQKQIDRNNNGISFLKHGKTVISPYQLSSGEKQMLIILLTALVQNNQPPTVMIMDEPELSLHTDWQEKLINYIRQLNENVQIIIATHSPSIVINGWHDKVFEINDILVK